jgi:hypothetical protein
MNVLPVTPYTPPSTHRPYLVPHLSHQPSTQLKPKKVFPQFQDSNRINSFQLLSLILKTKRFHFTFKKKGSTIVTKQCCRWVGGYTLLCLSYISEFCLFNSGSEIGNVRIVVGDERAASCVFPRQALSLARLR